MATPETIKRVREIHFKRLGLSDMDIDVGLDPYNWGNHTSRALLWIVRGHLTIVKPKDTESQMRMLIYSTYQDGLSNAMRKLESDNPEECFRDLGNLNLVVVSIPKPI